MPDEKQRLYWDSSVFLAYINGEEDRYDTVNELLAQSKAGRIEILTSTASIVEVAFGSAEKAGKALDDAMEEALDALWDDRDTIKLIDVSQRTQREARTFVRIAMERGYRCAPLDAMHMASAKLIAPHELHTYNLTDFKKFENEIGAAVVEPYLDQGVLGLG